MTTENNFFNQPIHFVLKPMLIGAGIAFAVISFFVFGVDNPNPEWNELWQARPLILTPLAGAACGAFYAFMNYQASRGFNKALALILSLVVFLVGLWMGVVLGLAGTMWN